MRIGILSAELGREDVFENKRLAKEILLSGHRPVIINYRKTVLSINNHKSRLYQPDKKGVLRQVRVDAVIPRINESGDKSIQLASLALECLIAGGVYSTAHSVSIRLAKNKIRSLVVMADQRVPIPRSAVITGTDSIDVDFDRVLKVVEPNPRKRLIVKTNAGTNGRGVMAASSRGEARAILDGFLANNIPVMIQQFVEPTRKNKYVDLRLIVVGDEVVAAMQRSSGKKDEIRTNIALGGKGSIYKPSETEIEIATRATKALGLAVAGVDIIPSGRKRLVIEVNTSPGFIVEEVTGVNVAKKIVRLAITGTRRGERPVSQKLADLLSTDIPVGQLKPRRPARLKRLRPVRKIKLRPALAKK
jgi:ribosomal protein S6--L-glutamate ligase